jgi:hypothetical protein
MTLYTMSGKRTTIAERDSMSEEERMADVRSKLFTLFDEDEREREMEERSKLINRATSTFNAIRRGFGEDEMAEADEPAPRPRPRRTPTREPQRDGYGEERRPVRRRPQEMDDQYERRPARRQPQYVDEQYERRPVRRQPQEMDEQPERRPVRRQPQDVDGEQLRPRSRRQAENTLERPAHERAGGERIEQAQRVKPVNPVRSMDSDKFERRGEPYVEGQAPRRDTSARVPSVGRTETRKPRMRDTAEEMTRRPEPRRTEPRYDEPRQDERYSSDMHGGDQGASFKLGDLFKEKEPDIFSQWERQEEDERRIKARRERRRAEAARREREQVDQYTNMKTAAALFVMREGIKNVFGKATAPIVRNEERDTAEREAEQAIKELARQRDDEYLSAVTNPMSPEDDGYDDPMRRRPSRRTNALPENGRMRGDSYAEPERVERPVRPARAEHSERTMSAESAEHSDRPERPARTEHSERTERVEYPERSERPGRIVRAAQTERERTGHAESAAREARTGHIERTEHSERPERKAFSRAETLPADEAPAASETAPRRVRSLRSQPPVHAHAFDDDGYEITAIIDSIKNPPRPTKTTIAWMAGGAAGAVAVVLIAMMIAGSQAAELAASAF